MKILESAKNRIDVYGDLAVIFLERGGQDIKCWVDLSSLEELVAIRWQAGFSKRTGTFYVQGHTPNGKVLIHRLIASAPAGLVVDHINHDTLDNRKDNLRIVSRSENSLNRKGPRKGCASGVRGVRLTTSGRWFAAIKRRGKNITVGTFDTKQQAEEAWLRKFIELGGIIPQVAARIVKEAT